MVYYKRKPVQLVSRPEGLKDTDDVWIIAETNEVFSTYEPFLQRMNFYKQKQFVCEGTGHSSLTFFEALESERRFTEEVNRTFPESLKEPVLRRVQFSTTSRIDHLVDQVYEEFKSDFYPGERVTVLLEDGSRLQGTVREKARFPQVLDKNGNVARRATSKYLVKLTTRDNEEALLADEHLVRDRKIFTKAMLRGFIKNSVHRESFTGAPWMVKDAVAEKYHIDTQIPKHLQLEQSKAAANGGSGSGSGNANGGSAAKSRPTTASTAPAAVASEETPSRVTTPRNYLKNGTKPTQGMFGLFASGDTEIGPRGGIKAGVKRKSRSLTQQDISRDTEQSYIAYQKTLNGKPEFTVNYSQSTTPTIATATTTTTTTIAAAANPAAATATTPGNVKKPAFASTPSTPSMPQPFIINGHVSDLDKLAQTQSGLQRFDSKHFDHISLPASEKESPYSNPIHALVAAAATSAPATIAPATHQHIQQSPAQQPFSVQRLPSLPPLPPPTIRYPIEDLEVQPMLEVNPRAALKFLEENVVAEDGNKNDVTTKRMDSKTVGGLLETWNTLNVLSDLLKLDSFTFDDYIDALGVKDVPPADGNIDSVARCGLLVEIHCAILKLLVEPVDPKTSETANGTKDGEDEDDEEEEEEEEIGNLMIELPLLPEEEEEEESEDEDQQDGDGSLDDEDEQSPEPERPTRRVTRSRTVARAEAEAAEQARLEAEAEAARLPHCAPSFFESPSTDWIARLAKREFRNGGWELVLVGLLDRLTYSTRPTLADTATRVLTKFVPADLLERYSEGRLIAHAGDIAAERYKRELDLHDRVTVVEMLTHLLMETHAVRQFLDECAMRSTELRKEKTEVQKKRKSQLQVVKKLQEEKRALMPKKEKDKEKDKDAEKDGKETKKRKIKTEDEHDKKENSNDGTGDIDPSDMDVDEDGNDDVESSIAPDTDVEDGGPDEASTAGHEPLQKWIEKKRRKGTTKTTNKEKTKTKRTSTSGANSSKSKQKNKEKGSADAKTTTTEKQPKVENKALTKVLAKIATEKAKVKELERHILSYDDQLRELETSRTRSLGVDRFWNKYYWFERNAMPFEGRKDSSTASAGYANGRLWVLGPDEPEVKGFMEDPVLSSETMANYGMTVTGRREKEEGAPAGSGGVLGPGEWGYYSEPEEVEKLLAWLDSRGVRELKLRKELCAFKEPIVSCMRARMADLGIPETTTANKGENGVAVNGDSKKSEKGTVKSESEPTPEPAEDQRQQQQAPRLRVSTRTQAHLDSERELLARHRSLRWKNTAAIRALGHLHFDSHLEVSAATPAAAAAAAAKTAGSTNSRKRRLAAGSAATGGGSRAASGDDTGTDADGSPAPGERRKRRR